MATLTCALLDPAGNPVQGAFTVRITTTDGMLLDHTNQRVLGGPVEVPFNGAWEAPDLTADGIVPAGAVYQLATSYMDTFKGRTWYWDGHTDATLDDLTTTGPDFVAIPSPGGGPSGPVDWDTVGGKPTFAAVATSGAYGDLSGKPSIPDSADDIGAEAIGVAANLIAAHIAATDPHGDRAWTTAQINALIGGAPGLLDTLGEIAAQLATDESAVGALTTAVNNKVNSSTYTAGLAGKAGLGFGNDIPDSTGLFPPTARQAYPQPTATDLVSQFETGHGWTGSAGFNGNDTSDYITGTQAAKITTSGTGSFKIESPTAALDMTAKQVRLRVKIDDITNVNYVNLWAGNDSSYTNAYKWFVQGTAGGSNAITSGGTTPQQGWVMLVLNVADAQLIGTPTRTGIVKIKAEIARTASAGEVTLHIDEIDLVPEPVALFPNGAAVICFDDILSSSWSLAKPILDAYRYRASHFVITDEVGQTGRVTADQLQVSQDEGHEINCHAFRDADHGLTYTGMTAAELDADLRAQKAWLRANGFRGDGTAYPLGQYGTTTDGVSTHSILRRYFSWARTTANGTNKPGGTYPIGDPYRVPALSSITTFSGGFTPTSLNGSGVGSLEAVAAAHGVKVLCFHKIVAGAPAALTEITTSDFQAIIDKIHALGMTVLTLGELYRAGAPAGGSSLAIASTTPGRNSGAGAAGATGQVSDSGHTHPNAVWTEQDSNRITGPFPVESATLSTALATGGTIYGARMKLDAAANITGIVTQVTTAGSGLTAGQCFAAIFQNGTLLGTTADQATAWAAAGVKRMALSGGPIAAAAGYIDVVLFFNGTTGPTLCRGNGNALINDGLTGSALKYFSADTGRTTSMPATLGTKAALSVAYWLGLY